MPWAEDSAYKCSLSQETLEKAKKELNEDPNTRVIEIKNLRKRVEKVPGLKSRTDLEFLLRFLRVRKFDQERTFQSVKKHYEVKNDPEVFADLKPTRVAHFLEQGFVEVLEQRNKFGSRVVVFRGGKWEPGRYPIVDMIKVFYLVLMHLSQEEETQVHGVQVINNLDGTTIKHITEVTPSVAKKSFVVLQDAIPIRLKRIDYVNEPGYFDAFFTFIKQFMKDKLLGRVTLHGSKLDALYDVINPDFLPTDLGGKLPICSNKAWVQEFLSSETLFEEENKYGYVNMALNSDQTTSKSGDAGIKGLGGTFKKLDI